MMGTRATPVTIHSPEFELRAFARVKMRRGQLPLADVPAIPTAYGEHAATCAVCNELIDVSQARIRILTHETIDLHELCYLAWWTEASEATLSSR